MGCATSVQVDHVVIETTTPPARSRQVSDEAFARDVAPPQRDGVERPDPHPAEQPFHEKYIVGDKLGKGAFAHVYQVLKASDASQERQPAKGLPLAVKISDLRTPGGRSQEMDVKAVRATEREATILKRVMHVEHCVKVFDVFMEGFLSYIVMERCDMPLIQALDREVSLREKTFTRYIREMAQGVANIHAVRVAHRDIKPDNFLCTGPKLTVKLCDFGLAEVVGKGKDDLKGVYGTAPFMAPEILSGGGCYGMKVDVWSIGVIMYVMMLGQFPYQPSEATPKAMKAAILSGVPAPTFQAKTFTIGTALSPAATGLLRELLNRQPQDRISAAEVLTQDWLRPELSFSAEHSISLRPCLASAKRAGAFDMRKPKSLELCEIDSIIATQQKKYHSADDLPRKGMYITAMSSGSSTRPGSRASGRDIGEPASSSAPSARSEQSETRKQRDRHLT